MEPSYSEEEMNNAQLEAIFRTHVTDLYRYIYRQVRHAIIAEDLTSIVFLKALRWLQQDRSPESVKGWLYATARSSIADYWHQQAQIQLLPLEAVEEMPTLSEESHEQMQSRQTRIQRLLDGLPSRDQQILTLRYLQGYSAAEIGQILGLSAKHVRVLQLRALRRAALLEVKERNIPMEPPKTTYNEQALRVLELAKEEALAFNHHYIGTEHLLLGVLREGSAATDLINLGVTLEAVRGGIMFIIGRQEESPPSELDFTPRTQKVLVLAGQEAQRLREAAISPHHLLIAILREGEGIAAKMLQVLGVQVEQVGDTLHISKAPETEEGPLTVPADFQEALEQHPAARNVFERLSFSKKKRFIDVLKQAEGEAARGQLVEKMIEQLQKISQQFQQ